MSNIEDIRRSLRSEKITERSKGKLNCEEILRKNTYYILASDYELFELLKAALDYESE